MSVVDHSAAGPAAGYEQQRQLALVLLCEAYARDPAVKVRLEAIEDIDVVSDVVTIDARVQVKHHLADHTLTDATAELWRTLTVWMDLEADVRPDARPRLHLVTTSVVDPDSAAALLGPEGRDVEAALEHLVAAAESSDASGTRAARERFLDLGQARQLQLLQAITVLDATARVVDLGERLRKALGLVVPSERPVEFLERVQGWWVGRSTQLLAGELSHVSGADLYRFCDALRDEFQRGRLAVGQELFADPSEEQKAPMRDAVFVRQLRMVMASSETLDLAVRHYYRAFAQRGRWERDLEDLEDDLAAYERRLCDEWEIAHVALRARVGPEESERRRAGWSSRTTWRALSALARGGLTSPCCAGGRCTVWRTACASDGIRTSASGSRSCWSVYERRTRAGGSTASASRARGTLQPRVRRVAARSRRGRPRGEDGGRNAAVAVLPGRTDGAARPDATGAAAARDDETRRLA